MLNCKFQHQSLLCYCTVIDLISWRRNGGEYPRAFVVRKEGIVTEKELSNMIRSQFASHKWLTGGVYFIDSIPRTGSGKVMRRNLPKIETNIPVVRSRL